jgi:TPR repeat protein
MNKSEPIWRAAWFILAASLFVLGPMGVSNARPQGSLAAIVLSAERGNPQAQTRLGFLHEQGIGVPQNYHLAAMWYHRAAEQGEPRAQHQLGILLNKGFGVRTNFIESYKWLNLAAAQVQTGDRGHYVRMRDAVASKLAYWEIAEGQRRASFWRPEPER